MDDPMRVPRSALCAVLACCVLVLDASAGEDSWYRAPTLAIMTGFIYEPGSSYSIRDWEKSLGGELDADQWARSFKDLGASYLIFYDKWIDGFVFHDTKTTAYRTQRDFVREIADACHRADLPLVFYFNAMTDGNPEFGKWALVDRQGRPMVFSSGWPTRVQTLHSPFRHVSVQQVRELLTQYGPVHGMWLDIFGDRGVRSTSKFVPPAYERMFGEPLDKATPARRAEFAVRTLAEYLDEARPIAVQHQPNCVWTANGSGGGMLAAGMWGKWVGSRLDYGSNEGHSFERVDQLARMAWVSPKSIEIGLLLNRSWFTPLSDRAPPAKMTRRQAVAAAAIGLCQGASVYLALTPSHTGVFGEDLQRARQIGSWFKAAEPFLAGARPCADVGILLGSSAADGPGFVQTNLLWKRYAAAQVTALDEAVGIRDALRRCGLFGEIVCSWGHGKAPSLSRYRLLVAPERVLLDNGLARQISQYVKQGGRLVAFGHASLLDSSGTRRKAYALGDALGAQYQGEVEFLNEAFPAAVYVDSTYRGYPGQNVLDDQPTFWASADRPMPHWVQINLPVPIELARLELVSRVGPYLVTDIDVESYDGKAWHTLKSIRGATTKVISASLAEPVRTRYVRVKILGELYQGKPRRLADVEAVRLLDTNGRNWATDRSQRTGLIDLTPNLSRAFGDARLSVAPMAVQVEATTAEVLARLGMEGKPPAILRNRYGNGQTVLITSSESAVRGDAELWAGLTRLLAIDPTLVSGDVGSCRVIFTQVGQKRVLHVIDPGSAEPKPVELSIDAERLGPRLRASRVDGSRLDVKREDGLVTFTLRPDPVATVVFE